MLTTAHLESLVQVRTAHLVFGSGELKNINLVESHPG